MRRILVTGAAGFIGSHLCDLLLREGFQVTGLDNLSVGRLQNLYLAHTYRTFSFIESSILDLDSLPEDYTFDAILHLAALADIVPSINEPERYFMSNVMGSFSVMEFAKKRNVQKVIYTASSSCYGIPEKFPTSEESPISPQYPYALTKYLGEQIVLHWGQVYGIDVTSFRLFNVYGPRARTSGSYGAVFGVFLAQKISGKALTIVGDGTQTRDFTYVSDVVRVLIKALQTKSINKVYNVGSGNSMSINHLANLIGGERTHIPRRPGEPDCTFADITRVTADFDWRPMIDFEDGVAIMLSRISDWQGAPVWDESSIEEATKDWFKYLGKEN